MQSFIFLASLVSELVGGGGASCYKNKAFQHSGTIIVSFFLGGGALWRHYSYAKDDIHLETPTSILTHHTRIQDVSVLESFCVYLI